MTTALRCPPRRARRGRRQGRPAARPPGPRQRQAPSPQPASLCTDRPLAVCVFDHWKRGAGGVLVSDGGPRPQSSPSPKLQVLLSLLSLPVGTATSSGWGLLPPQEPRAASHVHGSELRPGERTPQGGRRWPQEQRQGHPFETTAESTCSPALPPYTPRKWQKSHRNKNQPTARRENSPFQGA